MKKYLRIHVFHDEITCVRSPAATQARKIPDFSGNFTYKLSKGLSAIFPFELRLRTIFPVIYMQFGHFFSLLQFSTTQVGNFDHPYRVCREILQEIPPQCHHLFAKIIVLKLETWQRCNYRRMRFDGGRGARPPENAAYRSRFSLSVMTSAAVF